MAKLLIISPSFPPLNAPDMQRVRMSLPYYRKNGWEPIVLTVSPQKQEGTRDDALASTLPADVEVYHCGALPLWICRILGLRNLGLRSWPFLFFRGLRLIRQRKVDLVFISNTQFVTFTLGRLWRTLTGTPYVIDLQDPWRTDYYERPGSQRPPGGWKYKLARGQAWLLEGWSFRRMAGFMSVSENYIQDLRRRYRWFETIPAEVIRFGASEHDLTAARSLPQKQPRGRSDRIRFVYTGAAGPIMPHALRVLFGALRRFRGIHPDAAQRLQFEFVGTSYATGELAVPKVLPEAIAFGVEDQVLEVPQRLGHLESIQIQASADALLLLGSSDHAYSPSKLYPYYLSGRPMLSIVFSGSVLASLLSELNCSIMAKFEEGASTAEAEAVILEFFTEATKGFAPGYLPSRNDSLFQREYLASALTRRQCALFDGACRSAS